MNREYVDIFCSGQIRQLPRAIWESLEGPKPPHPSLFINNGCTMSPDYFSHKETWPACVIHDFHYNGAGLDRQDADDILRRNIVRCLEADGLFTWLAQAIAYLYWRTVRKCGRPFYHGLGRPD